MTMYRTFGSFKGEQLEVAPSVVALNRARFARERLERLKGELRAVFKVKPRGEAERAEVARLSARIREVKTELGRGT